MPVPGWPLFWGNNIKDISTIFKHLTTFSQTYSTAVFSTWHSFYGIKSVSNTDVHYIAQFSDDCTTFHITGGVSTISEFKHYEGPLPPNSRTSKHLIRSQGLSRVLKNGKKFSRIFKDFQGRVATLPCYQWHQITHHHTKAKQRTDFGVCGVFGVRRDWLSSLLAMTAWARVDNTGSGSFWVWGVLEYRSSTWWHISGHTLIYNVRYVNTFVWLHSTGSKENTCYYCLQSSEKPVFLKSNPQVFGGFYWVFGFFYLIEHWGSLLDDLAHQLSFYSDLPVLWII